MTVAVVLSGESEDFVRQKVPGGDDASSNDVIREAPRLRAERGRAGRLARLSVARAESIASTLGIEEIKAEGRRLRAARGG